MLKRSFLVLLSCLLSLCIFGCTTVAPLNIRTELPILDRSVASPAVASRHFRKIMVLPPSGTERGQFDTAIATFEREFLRNGVTVISGAVTGRVVFASSGGEHKEEGATPLSDVERALIMAKDSGADAIMQVGGFAWDQESTSRWFVYERSSNNYREATRQEHQDRQGGPGMKQAFASRSLKFIGRLIDVNNGEVMASFDIMAPASWSMPTDYTASYMVTPEAAKLISVNYDPVSALSKAERRSVERVVERVAEILSGKHF
ncbi:MAG: hypothetical protein ISR72_05555 [Methylobacter sp.]|nr:hypothetical protein [Methylobacter sp.]